MAAVTVTDPFYGPTPLNLHAGERAVFEFTIVGDAAYRYQSLTGRVKIFNGSGALIRTLEQQGVVFEDDLTARVRLTWDGKDSGGMRVPAGDYAPTFEATAVLED